MKKPNNPGISFPNVPTRWGEEERRFVFGLRDLIEQIQWRRAYPVGIVVFSVNENKPFAFGEWESVTAGITGVNAWKRVK